MDLTSSSSDEETEHEAKQSVSTPNTRKRRRSVDNKIERIVKRAKISKQDTSRLYMESSNNSNTLGIHQNGNSRNVTFRTWSCHDTLAWLFAIGFEEYVPIIEKSWIEDDIDGETLPELDHDDLKRMGIKKLLHRKRLLQKIHDFTS